MQFLGKVGITKSNNEEYRLNALKIIKLYLAKSEGGIGSILNSPNIISLLREPSKEIKRAIIDILVTHFNNTKLLLDEIIEEISYNIKDIELAHSNLEMLDFLVSKGESLGKYSLELINYILINHNDKNVRKKALEILNKLSKKHELGPYRMLLYMESYAEALQKEDAKGHSSDLEWFKKQIWYGHNLTYSVFEACGNILKDNNNPIMTDSVVETVVEILNNVIENKQAIPKIILESIEIMAKDGDIKLPILNLLDKFIKNELFLSEGLTRLVEQIITSNSDNLDLVNKALDIIILTSSNNKKISDDFIRNLCEKLSSSEINEEFRAKSLKILVNVTEQSTELMTCISDIFAKELSKNHTNNQLLILKGLSVYYSRCDLIEQSHSEIFHKLLESEASVYVKEQVIEIITKQNLKQDQEDFGDLRELEKIAVKILNNNDHNQVEFAKFIDLIPRNIYLSANICKVFMLMFQHANNIDIKYFVYLHIV